MKSSAKIRKNGFGICPCEFFFILIFIKHQLKPSGFNEFHVLWIKIQGGLSSYRTQNFRQEVFIW
jgi:hypothetical protein